MEGLGMNGINTRSSGTVILSLGRQPPKSTGGCTPISTAPLGTGAERWKQPKGPSTEDKQNVSYAYNGILRRQREGNSDTCYTRVDHEGIRLSKMSQSPKRKTPYGMIPLSRGIKFMETEGRTGEGTEVGGQRAVVV